MIRTFIDEDELIRGDKKFPYFFDCIPTDSFTIGKKKKISNSYASRIYKHGKDLSFSSMTAKNLKDLVTNFANGLGEQNLTNSKMEMDKFHNSHVLSDFDKSNKEVLKEALLREVIAAVRNMSMDSLMSLYLDLNIPEDENDEKETLQ